MVSANQIWLVPFIALSSIDHVFVVSEGPILDGNGWPKRMSVVMHNGHVDMKQWQEEIIDVERQTEALEPELETPPDDNDVKAKIQNVNVAGRPKRFVMDKKQLKWTHAIIPYIFDDSVAERTRQHIERDIFGLYEYWTHFRFVPWNASVSELYELGHPNYLIFVKYNAACWSYSGNNKILKGQKISCCKYVRCIHELGHAVGFYHEISNPIRDDYIRVNYQNIMKGMAPNFERIMKKSGVRRFGYYDMSSVMGYSVWAFSKNTRDTITVLDPETKYLTLQKDVTAYYMFYEVQQVYDMKAEKCPDVDVICTNGGYLSYVNGSCRCRCPEGLDYRSNCAEIEQGLSGGVIYLSDSKDRVNITSPGYPDFPGNTSPCVWFVKGPVGSKIVLDFVDFNIPYSKSCTIYVEIRFVMPGQPGIRYCGDSFNETVISYGEHIAITLAGNSGDSNGKFAASLRLIKDKDLCYTDGGKDDSYQGKVNYGRHFETCLPWDEVTKCSFHTFNVTWMDLKENYCRNPGHGTQPWCYVNAENCGRSYCDVCHLRKCYDIFDDCEKLMRQDSVYCNTDPEAKRGCRLSCGLCSANANVQTVSRVTCSVPANTVDDGVLISDKLSYRVGEKAVYRCNTGNSSGEGSITCTSEGTWTHIGYVCDDNPNCADRRLDCDALLESTPTMCAEYIYFARAKCARTCGLCTQNQKVKCDVAVVTGNVTETSTGPYYAGNVVHYTCKENFVQTGGNLDRACRKNQTLTGKTPRCSALDDTVSSIYHVDLRRRRKTSPADKIYTFSNTYYRIKRKGEIIAWQFYSLFSGKVTFYVWRQAGETDSFKLLGSYDLKDTLEDRLVTVNVSVDQRISVRPGDFIGVYFPATSPGGIVYDACKVQYDPEGGNQLVPTGSGPWQVGRYYQMKPTSSCKLFSISAKIGPQRKIDIGSLKRAWTRFMLFHK